MIVTLLVADIECTGPFAVRAPEEPEAVDLPIARDPAGNVYVPASSLAGSLRAHLRELGLAAQAMGPESFGGYDRGGDEGSGAAVSSPLRFLGTITTRKGRPLGRTDTPSRGQTAINRHRGSAETGTLRTVTAAPGGTQIRLYLRYDGLLPDAVRDAIASWVPTIGGSRTTGAGRARLSGLSYGVLDLTVGDDLRTWLSLDGRALVEHVATQVVQPVAPQAPPLLKVDLRVVDGLLVSGLRERNHIHLYRSEGVPTIEGSSLKGAIRSRAEFILRSLGVDACEGGAGTCGTCPTCEVFGSASRRALIAVTGGEILDAVVRQREHVAIDRVTGGARAHQLFDEEVVVDGSFELRIDALTPVPAWVKGLLLWVLRDLHDGLAGLGSRTTRGYGTVELVDPSVVAGLAPISVEAILGTAS